MNEIPNYCERYVLISLHQSLVCQFEDLDWNGTVIDCLIDPKLLHMEVKIIPPGILCFLAEMVTSVPNKLAGDAEEPDSRGKRNTR
jgi:hypothetical protein